MSDEKIIRFPTTHTGPGEDPVLVSMAIASLSEEVHELSKLLRLVLQALKNQRKK